MNALVFLFLVLYSSFAKASKTLTGFSVDLIHRDSPLSPFYNPSLTPSELIKNAALRSISRSNQVSQSLSLNENELLESVVIPNNGDYLMKIYMGTPPVERLVIADTGSDLTWVQCSPCLNCFPQNTPIYDPSQSSTFVGVSCDSQPCNLLPLTHHICGDSAECVYLYQYGDKSLTVGQMGNDSISLGSTGGGQIVKFPNFIFGCGHSNNFTFDDKTGRTTGLAGLGAGPLSLISQLGDAFGHKFSYCLLPFSSNSNSKLKFGNETMISGNGVVSTPLIIKSSTPTFYYLNLEGITVGHKTVHTGQIDGNIIIDSGTTLTYLEPTFYNDFVTSMKEVIGVEAAEDVPSPFDFCFTYQASMTFPEVVLHFTGADVSLKPKNLLFLFENNLLCLAVVPTNMVGISIFGNVADRKSVV